ncbi:MAG TPA: CehA/McbA family metallohydrolase [Acidobacteriota bacterium]|nr:CehA/McbA family metallohydrolase [Acidobacteriota bacterium]
MCHLVARGTITTLAILGIGCAPDTPAPAQQAESLERREARYIEPVPWDKEHITKAIGLGYPELGMEMDVAHSEMRTIDGRSCVVGNMVSFDVDDDYAFDIDEPVSVTLTYAPEHTSATSFQVIWDRNGGDGHGRLVVDVEPGATFRETTVTLDRARLAGLGAQRTDFAVGVSRAAVALCDVSIERSGTTSPAAQFGTVRLAIEDGATGGSMPARVGIYDEPGRAPLPSESAIPVWRFIDRVRRHWLNRRTMWPSDNRQAFYVNASYEARLPVGTYELAATHGVEYHGYHGTFEVREGETTEVTASLQRYDDLPSRGWFSGESHVHLRRDRVDDLDAWAQLAAEDVHVANLVEMGNIGGTYFKQPAWGAEGRFARDGTVLVSGQEDPRTGHRGHTLHWDIERPTHADSSTFYDYHDVFEQTRANGGITGYAHLGSLFNGERGLALDIPHGLIDFIEVLQGGNLHTDLWYDFLNLGYRVLPAAGADYPYFGPTLPGVERTYVQLDGAFSADAWFDGFREGRTYVTNGPFLEATVNGQPMGSEVRVEAGTPLSVVAAAKMNPEIEPLVRLELVVLGDVVEEVPVAPGEDRAHMETTLVADRSMWLAVRAYGVHAERWYTTVAHSAPFYVVVGDQPTWKTDAVPQLIDERLQHLQELLSTPIDPVEDLEAFETGDLLIEQWDLQLPRLTERVEEARALYEQLRQRHAEAVGR